MLQAFPIENYGMNSGCLQRMERGWEISPLGNTGNADG